MTLQTNENLYAALNASIESRQDRLVKFRRRLHARPEASNEEQATTTLIAERLREVGLDPQIMAGDTGIIADLNLGASGGSLIAVRCELDCVKVNDDKQVPYASTREGLCHACGHDAHSTISLATALALNDHRADIAQHHPRHNVRFIFQPAEEEATGARSMIKQGAIEGVSAIVALHVEPFLEPGHIGLRRGPMTAAFKSFTISIRGTSGHSARPHESIDPIPAATNIVSMLYQLAPRAIDGRHPLALTVGAINAGSVFNAIPDLAEIKGTLRTTRDEDIEAVQSKMRDVIRGVATATGADIDVRFDHSCPATDNDLLVTDIVEQAANRVVGPENVQPIDLPSMGGEDFAFYQELIPGAFFRVGAALHDVRARRPLHSSLFDIDETALTIGAQVMSHAVLDLATSYEATST